MLLDLHIHTSRYSRSCSVLGVREIAPRIRRAGLDGFCITEHDVAWSKVEIESLAAEDDSRGLVILTGREATCREGHVLIFGLKKRPPVNLPAAELTAWVRDRDGVSVLAHPFRFGAGLNDDPERVYRLWSLFDAVEALTPSHLPEENERALALGERFGSTLVAGSDAHTTEHLGDWATEFSCPIRDLGDLIEAIRRGACRPWRGRLAENQ